MHVDVYISVVGVCVGVLQECACMWSECVHVDVDMYTSAGSWSECMYYIQQL